MQVVFNKVPDDKGACNGILGSDPWQHNLRSKVLGCPAGKCIFNHLPGDIKTRDEFSRCAIRLIFFIPVSHSPDFIASLMEDIIEPTGAGSNNMRDNLTN